jgi:cytidine deaminase
MQKQKFEFSFDVYDSIDELNADDRQLLIEARKVTAQAYAPYSNFHVGAAARLSNNKIVTGTNRKMRPIPSAFCAERVLLSAVSSLYPVFRLRQWRELPSNKIKSDHPISPCGMCRQAYLNLKKNEQTNSINSRRLKGKDLCDQISQSIIAIGI